jgi:hypothetical protein
VDQDNGTLTVIFPWGKDGEDGARAVAEVMHGRWFDQRQIEAEVIGITAVTAAVPAAAPEVLDPLHGADLITFSVKQLKAELIKRGTY